MKISGHGLENMAPAFEAGLQALGVTEYFRHREAIARYPRIEQFLLRWNYI